MGNKALERVCGGSSGSGLPPTPRGSPSRAPEPLLSLIGAQETVNSLGLSLHVHVSIPSVLCGGRRRVFWGLW